MSDELKAMLESLTTDELRDVQTTIADLIAIAEESKSEDDGQPDEQKEQSDFAQDATIPYEEDDRPF